MAGIKPLVTGEDDGTTPPQTFGQKWGGPIAQGAGAIIGGIISKKAQQGALQRSPEEAAALKGAMGAAGGLNQAGSSMLQESRPYMAQPASYYQTLLRGSRGAMANAVAGSRGVLNDTYRGQTQQLAQSGVRGAAREQLAGDISRNRAAQVAKLTTGVQPYAAEELAKLGTTMSQTAGPMAANAGNIYQQVLRQGAENRAAALKEGEATGKPIGQLIADLGTVAFGGGKKPAADAGKKKPAPGTQVGTPPPTAPDYSNNTGPEFPEEEQPYDYVQSGDYGKPYVPPTADDTGGYNPLDYGKAYDPRTYGYGS